MCFGAQALDQNSTRIQFFCAQHAHSLQPSSGFVPRQVEQMAFFLLSMSSQGWRL